MSSNNRNHEQDSTNHKSIHTYTHCHRHTADLPTSVHTTLGDLYEVMEFGLEDVGGRNGGCGVGRRMFADDVGDAVQFGQRQDTSLSLVEGSKQN